MWTNSTRPPQRRQPSQWTMRLLSPWAPDDRLRRARSGIGAHARPETSSPLSWSYAGLAATPSRADRHAWNRAATTARKPWCRLPTRGTRSIADAAEQEQPLVVVRAASFIESERRVLTLASDAHDSAAGTHLTPGERRRARIGITGRRGAETGRRRALATASASWLRSGPALAAPWNTSRRQDDVPFAILGHRIFVFLPKKSALNKDVEAGGVVTAPHLPHVHVDRARDLLSAEDEFGFLFALRLSAPHGH